MINNLRKKLVRWCNTCLSHVIIESNLIFRMCSELVITNSSGTQDDNQFEIIILNWYFGKIHVPQCYKRNIASSLEPMIESVYLWFFCSLSFSYFLSYFPLPNQKCFVAGLFVTKKKKNKKKERKEWWASKSEGNIYPCYLLLTAHPKIRVLFSQRTFVHQ